MFHHVDYINLCPQLHYVYLTGLFFWVSPFHILCLIALAGPLYRPVTNPSHVSFLPTHFPPSSVKNSPSGRNQNIALFSCPGNKDDCEDLGAEGKKVRLWRLTTASIQYGRSENGQTRKERQMKALFLASLFRMCTVWYRACHLYFFAICFTPTLCFQKLRKLGKL